MIEPAIESSAEVIVDLSKKRPIRVLHVDDEPGLLNIAKQCLEMQGSFQVDTAPSVEEAMEKMKKEMYDAVVSDYVMPGKDGINFLKELREAGDNIPFIMFTGKGKEEIAVKALNLGADGYFSKIGSPETVYGELAHSIRQIVESKKAKEALRTNESYLRAILDSMFTGLIVIDEKKHKIVDANFHALETIGASREDVIGKICHKFICPAEDGKCPITDLGQTVDRSERVLLRADGQRIPILKTVTTIMRRGRKYLIESFVDISARARAEEALRRSENESRTLLENLPQKIFFKDRNSVYMYCNENYAKDLKIKSDEIRGRTDYDFHPKKLAEKYRADDKRIMEAGKTEDIEEEYVEDGQKLFVHTVRTPVKDEKGDTVGILGMFWDITERKRAEEELIRLSSAVEMSTDSIVISGLDGKIIDVNEATLKAYGTSDKRDLVGRNSFSLIAAEEQEKALAGMKEVLEKGHIKDREYHVLTKEGIRTPIEMNVSIMNGVDGKPIGFVATSRDITERKKMEEALRGSEEKYRTQFEEALDAIFVADAETGIIIDCNRAASELVGREKSELVGRQQRILHPREEIEGEFSRTFKLHVKEREGQVLETQVITKRGEIKDVAIKANVFELQGKKLVQGIFRDITEQKKAEEVRQKSEESFRTLMEEAPIGICNTDLKGNITYVNKRFEEATGYSREEIVGKNGFKFGIMSNEISKLLAKRMKERLMGKPRRILEGQFKRKDGEWIWAEVEGRLIKKFGVPVGFQLTVRDITERKRAEKERKYYEEKLSALNTYSRNLNMAANMDEIHELTLQAAEKTLGFEYTDILIIEEKMLCLVAHRGPSRVSSLKLPLHGDKGITVKAARTGKPVFVPDISKEKTYVEGGLGARSELAVPIMIGDKVLGVLNAESKELDAFNEKDRELLEILASHAATAISNLDRARKLETSAREIRESQQKFEGLFMDNPEAAVHLDPSFRIVGVNPRFTELFGYSLDEVKGKPIGDVIVPKDKIEEGEMLVKKALKGYVNFDTVGKRKDGSSVLVSVSAASITVEGQIVGYMGVYRDIAERKRYEERLSALHIHSWKLNTAESMEEIYQLTMDAVEKTLGFEIAFFMIVDKDMLRLVDHRGYPEFFSIKLPLNGRKRGVSVKVAKTGRSIIVPDAEKEDAWVEFMPGIRSGLDVPVRIGHKVLGVIGVDSKELNAFNEKDQELLEILASHAATAISNLEYAKNLEEYARETRESQQKFERLFMDNPEAAVHLDSSFHISDVNPRFMRLFGYSLDEIKGKHINDVIVAKDRMEEALVFDERASKGETYHEDTIRKRKDGSLVPVAFSAAPIIVENQVIGHIAMYKDISELKKAEEELRQTLEKLAKTNEKLRVVGGLTRHDARNKLSVITGNVYLAKKNLAGNNEVLNNLKEMELAAAQIVGIFDFAKTYEMLRVEELRFIDVEKIIDEAVSLFSDLKGVKVINSCRGLTVLADSLLRQLFYNLVDDSLKYGEKIKTITMYYEEIDKNKMKLVYEDDGVGITESEKKKLFQEGYGRGTGYGLYLIRKMCEGYGWNIQETGKEGEGAQFTITIPRIGEKREINYSIS